MMILVMFMSSVGGTSGVSAGNSLNSPLNANLDYAVVFVSRRIPSTGSVYYSQTGSMPGVQAYTRFEVAAPGKLVIREANGTLRTLINGSSPTPASLNLIDVNAPDVSYDGNKIVFSGLPAGSYSQQKVGSPGAWRIYTINVDGSGLRQVTFSDRNINLSQFGSVASSFTRYDDIDPAWLPDGRIVFSSTRWPSFAMYGAARTSNLYVVNENGMNLHRITAERNGAERPLIDPLTGKIVYSRWWRNFRMGIDNMATMVAPEGGYIMKDGLCAASHRGAECLDAGGNSNLERNAWQLATINPDGTGLAQFAGRSASFVIGELINHTYGGAFSPDGSFYANFFPMANGTDAAGFGGIRHYERGAHGYTPVIGITIRDESVQQFARPNPPSYGVYVGNYAVDPEVLPDGRLIISWAQGVAQDYGLYTINPDGSNRTLVYDNPGTTELRTRLVRPRPLPPVIPDEVTQIASALPPTKQGPYDIDGTFTFNALNVYFNAPVDAAIINAPPVGSANSIRFFIDHQRDQQRGSLETLDWPILLKEVPVDPDGSVSTSSPANVPLFEQLRTKPEAGYTIPLTGPGLTSSETRGAAHVAGENFGRTGVIQNCVGCHSGHTLIPVPADPLDAQWTNLATGAKVTVSSGGSSNGINDRRVKMVLSNNNFQKYWISNSGNPTSQWVKLTFPVPVTVRTIRLYNIPRSDSSIKVLNTTIRLYSNAAGTAQVASKASGALSENGTDISFNNIRARVVRIEFTSVNGSTAGLGEVEVIARAEADVPTSTISGNVGVSGATITFSDGGESVTDSDGIYSISVPNGWSGTLTPSHACFTFDPASRTYSGVTTNQTAQNYTPTFNPASGCANVDVIIGGTNRGNYGVTSGGQQRVEYTLDSGPVQVVSTNGVPIIAALRDSWKDSATSTWTSFVQMMGLPKEQLSDTYYFPSYNNVSLSGQLRFGNVDTVGTWVRVVIGGVERGRYYLDPSEQARVEYDLDSGPVVIESETAGVQIIVALRDSWFDGKRWTSFSQMIGLSKEQLSDSYYFPSYNNVSLSEQLRFGNVDTVGTWVRVVIGGVERGRYFLDPSEQQRVEYDLDSGPVVVESETAGVKIIAALRDSWYDGKTWTSYVQLMGLPKEQLSDTYYLPAYNNISLSGQLRFGNVDTVGTWVRVVIGGVERGRYFLDPSEQQRVEYDLDSGPVVIESETVGVKIIAALRDSWYDGTRWTSFAQMMGLPSLSDTYYFPSYNNVSLSGQLRFGVP
jgi:hypothetical protein